MTRKAYRNQRVPTLPCRKSASLLRATSLIALAGGTSLAAGTRAASADNLAAIRLSADRTVLTADGRSQTALYAQVYDDRGNVVPDGTRVRFSVVSGAGRLDTTVAATRNGIAQVMLTAADQPGSAIISAFLEAPGQAVPARIVISFNREADNGDIGANWVRINGSQYVGYAADLGVLQANGKDGKASIVYRDLTVNADTLQLNVKENVLRANGGVTLAIGPDKHTFSNLVFSLLTREGLGERIEDGKPVNYLLKGPDAAEQRLTPTQAPPSPYPSTWTQTWAFKDLSEASVTVVARSIQLEPNSRLQFRRATFYVDNTKTISMPYHVMDLGQDTVFRESVFGLTPQGVTFDFPVYYDVRPSGVGTLHVRRNARVGESAYSTRPGWSFDAVQAYNGPRNTNGYVELNGLSRPDWGARLRHAQRLGSDLTGSASVEFPNHRDLLVSTNTTRRYPTFNLNTALSGSRYAGLLDPVTLVRGSAGGDTRGQVYAETHDRTLIANRPVHFTLSAGVGRQSYYGASAVTQGTFYQQNAGTRLYTTPLPVARDTTFTQSMFVGQTWLQGSHGVGLHSGISLLGTSALTRSVGRFGSTSLSYNYTQSPAILGSSALLANGRHRLDLTAGLSSGSYWDFMLSASQTLDAPQANLYSRFGFLIHGPVRGRVSMQESRFSTFRYREIEYAVSYRYQGRDVGVYYSTTSRRFQFDFSGALARF